MQNKCGKFMQISIRNPVVLADAGVFVLFTWRNSFLAISFLSWRVHLTWLMPLQNAELNKKSRRQENTCSLFLLLPALELNCLLRAVGSQMLY